MGEFKVGDKVTYIGNRPNTDFYPSYGVVGTIVSLFEWREVYCEVKWESGSTSLADVWFVDLTDIKLAE